MHFEEVGFKNEPHPGAGTKYLQRSGIVIFRVELPNPVPLFEFCALCAQLEELYESSDGYS